jgi:hypothetical protein
MELPRYGRATFGALVQPLFWRDRNLAVVHGALDQIQLADELECGLGMAARVVAGFARLIDLAPGMGLILSSG